MRTSVLFVLTSGPKFQRDDLSKGGTSSTFVKTVNCATVGDHPQKAHITLRRIPYFCQEARAKTRKDCALEVWRPDLRPFRFGRTVGFS